MDEMRVGILINSFNLGGAEKLMHDVARSLKEKGISVFLISMKAPETDFEKMVYQDLMKREKFRVKYINKPVGKGKLKAILKIAKLIRKYKLDILHTNGQSPDFYGRLAKLLAPHIKTVVTIHSTSGHNRKIEHALGFLTDRYTAVSVQAREYAKNDLNIKKDIQVIINGVFQKKYENNDIKEKRGKNILSVGRVMPQKHYIEIIEDMSAYLRDNADAKWTIVGDITQDKGYFESVKALIPKEILPQIEFVGAVTNAEEYFKNADIFILPSKFEGFGLVFAEAMLSGLPVIARNVGIIPEIIEKGGKVIDLDKLPIAEAIQKAMEMTDDDILKNKEICIKNYSIDTTARQYLEVYKN